MNGPRRPPKPPRPTEVFDPLLQQERTSLAWERTAIAAMAAGVLLARTAAQIHPVVAAVGVVRVVLGSALLVWTGQHYDDLHDHLRAAKNPVHPTGARLVGVATTVFTGLATIIAVVSTFS